MANAQYTEQPYAFSEGKVLLADRAYTAAITTAAPGARQNGATPASYTDLGSINESEVTLEKDEPTLIDVATGLFEILRNQVATKDGDARATFTLVEYDLDTIAALTGDVVIGSESIFMGGRPLLQKAVLFVGENPATNSEFHHHNPKSNIFFSIGVEERFRVLNVTVRLLKFSDGADVANLSRDLRMYKFA